jgi:hypothetical protein
MEEAVCYRILLETHFGRKVRKANHKGGRWGYNDRETLRAAEVGKTLGKGTRRRPKQSKRQERSPLPDGSAYPRACSAFPPNLISPLVEVAMSKALTPRTSQRRPAPQPQVNLERELVRTQEKIRLLDILTAAFVLVVAGLIYLALMVGADNFLHMSDGVRQLLLGIAVLAGGVYAFFKIAQPLWLRINPYFAARAIEKSSPNSKNSVTNWLDLREEPINPHIRDAIEKRAALEVGQAEMEKAVPTKRPKVLFMSLTVALVVILILRALFPEQFISLVQRAIYPFTPTPIPTDTRLQLLKPVEDAIHLVPDEVAVQKIVVPPGQPVPFMVQPHGKMPEAVYLECQASLSEKPTPKPMNPPRDQERKLAWTYTLSARDIPAGGLYVRAVGGDGKTPLYQLVVSANQPPRPSNFEVTVNYPRYTRKPPRTQNYAEIKALAGSQVEMAVVADQPVKIGHIELFRNGEYVESYALVPEPAEKADRNDRRLVLEKPWQLPTEILVPKQPGDKVGYTYKIGMTNLEGTKGLSPEFAINLEEDATPTVRIQRVGIFVIEAEQKPIQLPQNCIETVEGDAWDDFAVDSVRMRIKRKDGPELAFVKGVKIEERGLQKPTGYAQDPARFQLTLDLTKLIDITTKQPVKLAVGDHLELWAEATDTAEPKPHTGKSKPVQIEIIAPVEDEVRKDQEKQQQEQEQKRDKERAEEQQKNGNPPPQQQQDKNQEKNKDQQQKGDPQKGDPQGGDPQKGDPQKGDQNQDNPQKGNPEQGDPQKGDPNKGEPNKGDPQQGAPNKGDPQKGNPQQGDPNKGDPQKGNPQEQQGDPQKGNPQQGEQQKGDPQKNNPEQGKPPQAAPPKSNPPQPPGKHTPPHGKPPHKADPRKDQPQQGNQQQPNPAKPQQGNPQKGEQQKSDPQKANPQAGDPQKSNQDKGDPQKGDPQKGNPQQGDPQKGNTEKGDTQKDMNSDPQKGNQEKGDPQKGDANKGNPDKNDPQAGDPTKGDPQKGDPQAGDSQKGNKANPDKGNPDKGDPQKGNPEKGDPQAGDPNKGDPQKGNKPDPQKGDPQAGDPQKGDMNKGDPQKGNPQAGNPDKGDPQKGNPDKANPQQGDPQKGDMNKGDPQKGNPEKGNTEKGDPQKGDPQKGNPQQGDPQKGDQQKGNPDKGEPQAGDPQKGDPQKGNPQKANQPKGDPQKGQPKKDPQGKECDNPGDGECKNPGEGQGTGNKSDKTQNKAGSKEGDQNQQGGSKPGEKSGAKEEENGDKPSSGMKEGDKGKESKDQPNGKQPNQGQRASDQKGQPGDQQAKNKETQKKADDLAKALQEQGKEGGDKEGGEPGKEQGQPGGNQAGQPGQAGNTNKLLPGESGDEEHSRKATDLTLENLRDQIAQGKIDKRTQKALEKMKLTPEQAKKLIDQYQAMRGQGGGKTTGPRKAELEDQRGADMYADPNLKPPPELAPSYDRYSLERARSAQQPKR